MKLVRTAASIAFEEVGNRKDEFEREFESFSSTDSNPVDDFIQKMKAKEGKNAPDDMTILLLAELHKKVDDLTRAIKGETKTYLPLTNERTLDFAWFDTVQLQGLKSGVLYYARISMPLFRTRVIPFFFEATDEEYGTITKMWPNDKADFDGYLASKDREEVARERALR
jgi:hypothetical protein